MWRGSARAFALAALAAAGALAVEPAAPGADPEFERIVSSATPQTRDAACEQMQRWVDAHPSSPLAPRGLVWMAQLQRAERRPSQARALLERVLGSSPRTEWALHATQGLAELETEAHRYSSAIARYEVLAGQPKPLWRYLGANGIKNAQAERLRFALVVAIAAAVALLCAARLARAGLRSLWPPPRELIYPLPILLALLAAATAQEHDEARAVVTLAVGAAALLWLNGAFLRSRAGEPATRPRRLLRAALGVAQLAGLLYCSLAMNHLWAKLMDTIAMGRE